VASVKGEGPTDEASYRPVKKPKNRAKHNESESKRRSRLRDKFFQLRDAAHSNKKDRFNILTTAIEKLQTFESKLQHLQSENRQLKAQLGPKSSGSSNSFALAGSSFLGNLAVAQIALDGKFRECNEAFADLIGLDKNNLSAASLFSLTPQTEMITTFSTMKKLLTGELKAWETDRKVLDSRGELISVHMTLSIATVQGKPSYYVCIMVPKQEPAPELQTEDQIVVTQQTTQTPLSTPRHPQPTFAAADSFSNSSSSASSAANLAMPDLQELADPSVISSSFPQASPFLTSTAADSTGTTSSLSSAFDALSMSSSSSVQLQQQQQQQGEFFMSDVSSAFGDMNGNDLVHDSMFSPNNGVIGF